MKYFMCAGIICIIADGDIVYEPVIFEYFTPYTEHERPPEKLMIIQYIGLRTESKEEV